MQLPERPEAVGCQRRRVLLVVHKANLVLSDPAAACTNGESVAAGVADKDRVPAQVPDLFRPLCRLTEREHPDGVGEVRAAGHWHAVCPQGPTDHVQPPMEDNQVQLGIVQIQVPPYILGWPPRLSTLEVAVLEDVDAGLFVERMEFPLEEDDVVEIERPG